MKTFTAIIEKCSDTGFYVGYIPTIKGAHSQGRTISELETNLKEVLELLYEEGEIQEESQFIGTQLIEIEA
jgi:predicted RNase H-like HicB family nuclease